MSAPMAVREPGVSALSYSHTDGAVYTHDGTLEGIFSAIYRAMRARDSNADILQASSVQARLDQQVVDVKTELQDALKVRRTIEHALGTDAYLHIRAAAASDDEDRGTVIYRFIVHALAQSSYGLCTTCSKKRICTRACAVAPRCPSLNDLSSDTTLGLLRLSRAVMNERHRMIQFIRFEHCAGDVWFARCNPTASVVPLLMEFFAERFNDQRFVIYDENHALSGAYDGSRWHLVRGDAVTPPERSADEAEMRRAWRLFYRCLSVDVRYHPELRRGFMPMRLWRNLPELEEDLSVGHPRGPTRG